MMTNEFSQAVCREVTASGRHCEWCNKPALFHITAIGGAHHNQSGYFCALCSNVFKGIVDLTNESEQVLVLPHPSSVEYIPVM